MCLDDCHTFLKKHDTLDFAIYYILIKEIYIHAIKLKISYSKI